MRRIFCLLILVSMPLGCSTAGVGDDDFAPALWVNPVYTGQMERGTEDEPFKSIDKALAHANPATRIHLAEGTYRVNLKVDKQLALSGDDPAKRPVLRAANPRLPVIQVKDKAVALLTNLEIGSGSQGVQLGRRSMLQMSGCLVQGNTGAGISLAPSRGWFSGTPPLSTLQDCTISGNDIGISLADASISVVKCTVQSNRRQGIAFSGDSALLLSASHINQNGMNGALLDLGSKARVTVYQCDIKANGGDGLHVVRSAPGWFSGSQMQVEESTFSGNRGWGIGAIDGATGKPTAMKAGTDPLRLEMNSFAGNEKGMASGIEAR